MADFNDGNCETGDRLINVSFHVESEGLQGLQLRTRSGEVLVSGLADGVEVHFKSKIQMALISLALMKIAKDTNTSSDVSLSDLLVKSA